MDSRQLMHLKRGPGVTPHRVQWAGLRAVSPPGAQQWANTSYRGADPGGLTGKPVEGQAAL